MTFEQMKGYVDKCMEAYSDSIREICLTGGECMLLKDDVFKILEYSTSLGLICNIVTNGFWATSYKKAYNTLLQLKNVGLKSITLSTGDDHGKWVPLKRVRDAAIAAIKLDLIVTIRIEQGVYSGSETEDKLLSDAQILNFLDKNRLKIELIRWLNYSNEEKATSYPKSRDVYIPAKDECTQLFKTISITPYGDVMACCGISCARIPQLRLGNIDIEPINEIYERAFEDHLKIWLHTKGPHSVLQFVRNRTNWRFNSDSVRCAACMEIFGSERILNFLREHYFEWAKELMYSYYPKIYQTKTAHEK
jgi:MoaA/NifB/PqqE/SkfB family radical SAM enzyme